MDDAQLKLSNQVCFPIYSASRLITKAYKPYLDEMGITYPQYLVLMVLWENDILSVNQITEKLLLNTNTLSPLLKRMERMQLLQPDQLIKILLTENIKISDVLQLKEMLNEWIKILTEDNKNLE